jgi:hypothetical protein
MMEALFVVYILLLFIFPVPILIGSAAAMAHLLVYQKYLLLRRQPAAGKKLLFAAGLADFVNFIASLLLAFALAGAIHFAIFEFFHLFAFNAVFCFGISIRWFDFAFAVYRKAALNLGGMRPLPGAGAVFVTCTGYRKASGWGSGLTPVFMDSGYLSFGAGEVVFDGVFSNYTLGAGSEFQVVRKSSEKIKILLAAKNPDIPADALLFVVRERFYPFKSRVTRDAIVGGLEKIRARGKTPSICA